MRVWWQGLSRRERVLVVLLGVVVTIASVWRGALEPAVTRIQRLRRDLAAAEAALAEQRTAQAALESYRVRLAELQREAADGARRVPRDLEPAAVGVFVEQAARGSGVRLLAIDLGTGSATRPQEAGRRGGDRQKEGPQGEGRFRSWPVKVEVAGSYEQLVGFVRALEGWERLWRLERVELVPQVPGAGEAVAPGHGQSSAAAVLRVPGSGAPGPEGARARAALEIVLFTDAEAPPLEDRRLEELGVTPQETGSPTP